MTKIIPDYQIAAGNNNAAGLTPIDQLSDGEGVFFVMPRGLPFRARGFQRTRLNGTTGRVGFNSTQWVSSIMTLNQLDTIYDTYELGEASGGLVTIRIALTSKTYANYNAVLRMQDEIELNYIPNIARIGLQTSSNGGFGPGYTQVTWFFTKLEAI